MQLTWRTSFGLCCLHAANELRLGRPLVDQSLAALAEPVEGLGVALDEEYLPKERFWELAVPLSAEFGDPRALAEGVLIKLQGRTEATIRVPRFARLLSELRGVFQRAQPHLAESLPTLLEPARQRWTQSALGVLAGVPPWTDAGVLVEEATIFVAPPLFAGGGGAAHLPYNSVRIEAIDDADPELPENLRLAWLLSQLNLDVPAYSENIPPQRLPNFAGLATIPVTLAAAEAATRAACTPELIERAVRRWLPGDRADAWSATTLDWWETYRTRRPAWTAALVALDRLLADAPPEGV